MRLKNLILWVTTALALAPSARGQPAPLTGTLPSSVDTAIVLDQSKSMEDNGKMAAAKQAGKLACLVLDGRVQFVGFSSDVNPSPVFDLHTQRQEAITWVEKLETIGGTRYLRPLEVVAKLHPKNIVFCSDGEPEDNLDDILKFIHDQLRCPVHTVAVQTNAAAQDLLTKMAAATGAAFHRVDEPARLVDAFLGLLGQMRRFRQFELTGNSVTLPDVNGEILAIGFDAVPKLAGSHGQEVVLTGSRIHVTRSRFAQKTAVTVQADKPGKRVVVLRFDQAAAQMRLGPVTVHGNQAQVPVEVEFRDPAGKVVDPRGTTTLGAILEAVDPQGRVIQRVEAQPSPNHPVVSATMTLPSRAGEAIPYVIRTGSTDRSSGVPFIATESQAVVIDPAKSQPAAPPADNPPTRPRSLDSSALQLLVVAQRQRIGRKVVFDSVLHPDERDGVLGSLLEGDPISLELVRGDTIDAREFVSMGPGLRARMIGDDGAVTDVPLTLNNDRYVTTPVAIKGPGILAVHVDVSVTGLELHLKARLAVERLTMQLDLAREPIFRKLSVLPCGVIVPIEVAVLGKIKNRVPDRDDFLEMLHRHGVQIVSTLSDSAGGVLARESVEAGGQPWSSTLALRHTGEQVFGLELVTRQGIVLDGLRWKFEVTAAPVQFALCVPTARGDLAPFTPGDHSWSWLPGWFTWSPTAVIVAKPTKSAFFSSYFLASVRVGDARAEFDETQGCFVRPVPTPGAVVCTGTLKPYGWSTASAGQHPELQVSESVAVVMPIQPRWGRLAALSGAVLALMSGGFVGLRHWHRRRLEAWGYVVRLYVGGDSDACQPIVRRGSHGWTVTPEILICRDKGGERTPSLEHSPCPAGKEVVARVRQHANGSVSFHADKKVPGMSAGSSRLLSLPGLHEQPVSDTATIVLERAKRPTRSVNYSASHKE